MERRKDLLAGHSISSPFSTDCLLEGRVNKQVPYLNSSLTHSNALNPSCIIVHFEPYLPENLEHHLTLQTHYCLYFGGVQTLHARL